MRITRADLAGPVLTAIVLGLFIVLDATIVRVQNPAPIFLIAVTFAGYTGGVLPALISAGLAIAFSAYYFSAPGELFVYSQADQARLTSIVLGTVTIALLTGVLRERLVRAEQRVGRERLARVLSESGIRERRRFFEFLEAAPASIALTRGADHVIEIANARFRAGAGGGDPVGRTIRDAFAELDTAGIVEGLDRVFATGEVVSIDELPVRYEDPAGTTNESFLNAVLTPSVDATGTREGVFLFVTNVTESVVARKHLEALLSEQERERARLQMIIDQLPEGVTISGTDGTFILRNQAADQLFPWSDRTVEAVISGAEYLRPDGTPYPREDLPGARARRGETVQGEELIVRTASPSREVPILMSSVALRGEDGTLAGTLSVFQDISHLKRIERERALEQAGLRDSETRLRATVAVALDALISMDLRGDIIEWNPSAEAMFGWRRGEVVGREMASTIIPERYREPHRAGLRHFIETGQGRVIGRRIELEALHRDGHEFPIELAISAIETSAGQSFIAFLRDITARRRLEAAQATALVEVRQTLRLRVEFLSAAAHDLKTPLTSMQGHLQLVRRRSDDLPPAVTASLDEADRAAKRMVGLINELLDVARIEAGQTPTVDRKEMDLNVMVNEVCQSAARQGSRHSIAVDAKADLLVGRWDPVRIERALANVVSNAVKYSPAGGEVTVTTSREHDGQRAWAVVSVADHGIGIPAEDLPRLFTRFQRGSNTAGLEGTGVGLEATRRTVELHDGTIELQSTEGAGTTVTIRLPLDEAP